jgi:prepilin-type N-terminal cleavage/methylation domain-containing protein
MMAQVPKYMINLLKFMISKLTYFGQHKKISQTNSFNAFLSKEAGFSMIETLIVAAVLGALSLFAMELLDRQTRMLKTVENKFALQSVHAQISNLLSASNNCLESFRTTDIKAYLLDSEAESDKADNSVIPFLQKEFLFKEEDSDEVESEYKPTFHTIKSDPSSKYEGLTITKYNFDLREDNLLEQESLSATVSLNIYYDLGPNTLGGRQKRKSLNLSLKFSEENPSELTSCKVTSSGAINKGSLIHLNPIAETEFKDMTGDEACESIGKGCVQVLSQNYASKAYGQIGIGNLCQINYNKTLQGVKKGSPVSNIHDCTAKLGQFETYKIEKTAFGVTCQGIFTAQCQ